MKKLRKRGGMVFVASLSMMLLMFALGTAYLQMVKAQADIAHRDIWTLAAFYAAESGVEHSVALLKAGLGAQITSANGFFDSTSTSSSNFSVTSHDSGNKIVEIYGQAGRATGSVSSSNSHEIYYDQSPYTGALQIGLGVPTAAAMQGTIYGNVDATGSIHTNLNSRVDPSYTITANNTNLTVPVPDMTASGYGGSANFTGQGLTYHTHANCTDLLSFNVDVHFVTGSCVVTSVTGFTLNGALIVDGDLTIGPVSGGFTNINPPRGTSLGDIPAVVAAGNVIIQNLDQPTFDGVMYSGGDMTFSVISWGPTITDPLLVAGNLHFTQVNINQSFTLSNVDPPFFSGGGDGSVTIAAWKGHI